MPQITDLKNQLKNADRISVFVDGKYSFSLNTNQIVELGVKMNQALSGEDVKNLKRASQDGKIQDSVNRKLMRRKHSVYEIQLFMKQKGAEQELIDKTISELEDKGFLNDKSFAQSWIEERRTYKQRSNIKIKAELLQKGVDKTLIEELLKDSEDDQLEALKELIERKRSLTRYKDEKKLIAYLQRSGFNYYDIKEALSSLED